MDARAASQIVEAATNRAPASLGPRRTTDTHEFYRYPARFTPSLARAAIEAFTSPGDLVLDPFVGGGTTLVESRLTGRIGIGNDLNQLATFVARIKSTVYPGIVLDAVTEWAESVVPRLNIQMAEKPVTRAYASYLRNVEGADVWRLRRLINIAKKRADQSASPQVREFLRCAILRTSQWALDMRDNFPSVRVFRDALAANLSGMVEAAREYARQVRRMDRLVPTDQNQRTAILTGRAQDLSTSGRVLSYGPPKLVLTSPPYPGVYVNYHRWKLQGRLETPMPYWIAQQLDGKGIAYYTMSANARGRDDDFGKYFTELEASFAAVASLCDEGTTVMQVVGFSEPKIQLPLYLETMGKAGFREVTFARCANAKDGRLWRDVPGRRWWTRSNGTATSKEAVLFHRAKVLSSRRSD